MLSRRFYYSIIFFLFTVAFTYSQQDSFPNGGLMRSFIIYAPSGISNPALVINMHGMGSNASQQRLYTQFDKIADREKFIVAYPNGVSNSWDVTGSRDVTFILALIDTIDARFNIDRTRVYATGMSMGGYMSHRLGCAASGSIAAIAPVAGLCVTFNCTPSRPMPVLQIHGTADTIVKYSGVAATISFWVSKNGCPQTPQTTSPYPASNPNSKVSKDYYGPCSQGSEVVLLTVNDGGHAWPGGWGASQDINASEEAWAFFKRHALQAGVMLPNRSEYSAASGFSVRYYNGRIHVVGTSEIKSMVVFDPTGRIAATLDREDFCVKGNSLEARMKSGPNGLYFFIVKIQGGVKIASCLIMK